MGRSTFSGPVAGAYVVVALHVPGTISVADGVAKWAAPFACRLVHVGAWLKTTGTTSGDTSIQVSVGATDYLTATLDIAYNDADGVAASETFDNQDISKDDVVEIDIDSVAGGNDSADLTVYLTVYPTGHTVNT